MMASCPLHVSSLPKRVQTCPVLVGCLGRYGGHHLGWREISLLDHLLNEAAVVPHPVALPVLELWQDGRHLVEPNHRAQLPVWPDVHMIAEVKARLCHVSA
jgi:hypothetical protein